MNVEKAHSMIAWGWRSKAVSKKRKQTSFPHRKITPSAFFPSHRRHFVNFMYLLRDGDISWTMTSSGHFCIVHENSPKSVHEKSPFEDIHDDLPTLQKSVH